MMSPDRRIVQRMQEYDKELYVKWNNRDQFFEVWRSYPGTDKLITPVTRSIYYPNSPRIFTPLDERILWWLYEADGWRHPNIKRHVLERDNRWKEWNALRRKKQVTEYRDRAKDIWTHVNSRYVTKHASENRSAKGRYPIIKPKVNDKRWIAPDVKAKTSNRLWSRSGANARSFLS